MNIDFHNYIQAAGILDLEEAELLLSSGVEFLGFPLRLAYHKEDISEETAAEIIRRVKPRGCPVIITYLNDAAEINALLIKTGSSLVQLHGDITQKEIEKLKEINAECVVIKSLIIGQKESGELENEVRLLQQYVDAFITDTYDPSTGATGATGKTHDWKVSKRICEISEKPVILAGGLKPENVRKAIIEVKPAGVDVHTGIEDNNGRKNVKLVNKFLSEARAAFAELNVK